LITIGDTQEVLKVILTPGQTLRKDFEALDLTGTTPIPWPLGADIRLQFNAGVPDWVAVPTTTPSILRITASGTAIDAAITAGVSRARLVIDGERVASGCVSVDLDDLDRGV
jgi:hypothetical protein